MRTKRSSPNALDKTSSQRGPVYRVDIFNVPAPSRRRFLDRVEDTHRMLRTIPGFVEDHILERPSGSDSYNIVTIVVWKDDDAVGRAKTVVSAWHSRTGFNRQKLMQDLGVEAAIGEFRPVELAMTV